MRETPRPAYVYYAVMPCLFAALAAAIGAILAVDPDVPKHEALFEIYAVAGVSGFVGSCGAWWGKPLPFGCGGLLCASLGSLASFRAWAYEGKIFLVATRVGVISGLLLFLVVATQYKKIQIYGEDRQKPHLWKS